jgi:GTP-binding protein HflX
LRNCRLPDNANVVLADTVGFIRHLPHELVAAFKSTLQEASESDLLMHVIDAHSEHRDDVMRDVNQVLVDIGADKISRLEVFNKIDLLENCNPRIDRDDIGKPIRVWLSAQTGEGVDLLLSTLGELLKPSRVIRTCRLRPEQGDIRAKLFSCAKIIAEHINDTGDTNLIFEIDNKNLGLLKNIKTEEVH